MTITYTNRKGFTYTLCKGSTKTGKPRYFFSREPKGELVAQIPEGCKIVESVNGVVSLTKDIPGKILADELVAVQQLLDRHPHARQYRLNVKPDRIQVYEGHTQFMAVLQFILCDEKTRRYMAERWCFLGSIDDWISIDHTDSISALAARLIPKLGTDGLFEVF